MGLHHYQLELNSVANCLLKSQHLRLRQALEYMILSFVYSNDMLSTFGR